MYAILFDNVVESLVIMDENVRAAHAVVVAFQCFFWLLMAFWFVFRGKMAESDVRRNVKTAANEEGFSPAHYFCKTFVKDCGWKTAAYMIFQLPFTIFFASFGLALDETMIIVEKFYIADAGFYAATGSAILGLLLSAILFFAIMVGVSYISYRWILREKTKNS